MTISLFKILFLYANWENQNITYILNFPVQSIAELPHSQYKRVLSNSKKMFLSIGLYPILIHIPIFIPYAFFQF